MTKIVDFLKTHKYAIIWTVCYTATMWIVLKFLFNFDMLSHRHWQHLLHAQLRGFPGFVFGILILAALPLYIASTTLIIRTKKPLFIAPVPKIMKQIWSHMQPTLINPPAPAEPTPEKSDDEDKADTHPLPDELPSELRTAYIRARMNICPEQQSAINQPAFNTAPRPDIAVPTPEPTTQDIPLPTDFEFEPTDTPEYDTGFSSQTSVPTFTDISFDDVTATSATDTETHPISDYLNNTGQNFKIIDNIIVTDKHAIASHTDPDFWVCDTDYWFATGKQIASPITSVIKIATEQNLRPILYLGADNIMDLDTLRGTWESMGITVITDPTQLPQ